MIPLELEEKRKVTCFANADVARTWAVRTRVTDRGRSRWVCGSVESCEGDGHCTSRRTIPVPPPWHRAERESGCVVPGNVGVQAKSWESGPRPADEQSCGLSLDLYKSPDPQNRCLPCRRCLPRSLRQTTPTRQTDLSSDRSYELRAHLSPPFPGGDLYNSRPVLYNSLRGREAICTTHSERCVVFVAEELFCLNHRHFENVVMSSFPFPLQR